MSPEVMISYLSEQVAFFARQAAYWRAMYESVKEPTEDGD